MISLQKPVGRAHERRARTRAHTKAWRALKIYVMRRDKRRCRVCGSRDQVDPHHVIFKSAGGKNTKENVAAICRIDHDEIHAYRLFVKGNAEKTLRIWRPA